MPEPGSNEIAAQQPVRVAFLIDNLVLAGTETWLLGLIRGLDRAEFSPHLCLLDGGSEASRCLEPVDVPLLRLGLRRISNPRDYLRAARQFVRYLRGHQIQVVQLHFPDSTFFGAPLAKLAGARKVIATSRNAGHDLTPRECKKGRFAHRFVDLTIANSRASKQAVVDAFGLDPSTVEILPNGIDLRRFSMVPPLRAKKAAGEVWRIGIVANLRPVKDIATFVRAAGLIRKHMPDTRFFVAGEGSERGNLEALINELDLDGHVELLGKLEDVPSFLGSLDVAVLSSQSEGCSNALLEYMAAGRAIVASSIPANLELIDDTCGLTYPVGDAAGLANGVLQLLVGSSNYRCQLARNARERCASPEFSPGNKYQSLVISGLQTKPVQKVN